VKGARDLAYALHSLLHYPHLTGLIHAPLAWVVPQSPICGTAHCRGLVHATVDKLLASCDQRMLADMRDHTILLLLSRLGLRAPTSWPRLDGVD